MIFYALGSFAITFFNTILLVLTFKEQRINPTVKYYYQWTIFVTLWSLGYGITLGGFFDYSTTLIWNRFCQAMAVMIGPFFFKLCINLIGQDQKHKKAYIFYLTVGITNAILLFLTEWYVKGLWQFHDFKYQPDGGPLYILFVAFFVLCNLHGYFLVFKHYLNATGLIKKQLQLFLLSTGIGYGFSIELFLQGLGFAIDPHAVFIMFLYVIILGYAIHRYKFLDIPVLIKNTIIFTGIVTAAVLVIALPFAIIQAFIGGAFGAPNPFLLMTIGIATTVFIYRPVERLLTHLTDRYLFQKEFDYRRVLKTASEGLANINSLDHQLRLVVHFMTMRVRIKTAAIYMPVNGDHDFVLKSLRPASSNYPERISFDSPILLYLKSEKERKYLDYQSVEIAKQKYKKTAMFSYDLPKLLAEMKRLGARLIIPSFYQGALQGILVLGGMKSDEDYSEEDIEVFQTIAQESAIAFENARKHDEIICKNQELETMNDQLQKAQGELIMAKQEAAVSQLSGGISHEVNNAVLGLSSGIDQVNLLVENIIECLSRWYSSGEPVPVDQKKDLFYNIKQCKFFLHKSRHASRHIEGVVQTLSQMSKGKHAKMTMVSVKSFLNRMVSIGMLRTYGDRLRTQALEEAPKVEAETELPLIHANVHLLQAVFLNLFKNAIHAMDNISPKRITLRAAVDPEDKDMMRIEFSDNGKGIPADVLPRIFDYGFTTKGEDGEGKGLYNVKNIIEGEHHGSISVQSEEGKGTTFIIKIPLYRDPDQEDQAEDDTANFGIG